MNRIFLYGLVMMVLCGCGTGGSQFQTPYIIPQHGRVVRINPEERYVILECTVLPIEGEVITLYRNNRVSGKVRAGRQSSGKFVAADIMEGDPITGDWFRGITADSSNRIQPVL